MARRSDDPAVPGLTRAVRGLYDDTTLTVYQAYSPAIADAALAAGRFVPPFRVERMTWIKPSYLWMMYRSGWATKPGQERVLAVRITRDGFAWALAHACLSTYVPVVHESAAAWKEALRASPVRVQWDPDRTLTMQSMQRRAIQVGLSGEAVSRYVEEWTVSITDVTEHAHRVHALVRARDLAAAEALLPQERELPPTA